jgi:hypothetical protein
MTAQKSSGKLIYKVLYLNGLGGYRQDSGESSGLVTEREAGSDTDKAGRTGGRPVSVSSSFKTA